MSKTHSIMDGRRLLFFSCNIFFKIENISFKIENISMNYLNRFVSLHHGRAAPFVFRSTIFAGLKTFVNLKISPDLLNSIAILIMQCFYEIFEWYKVRIYISSKSAKIFLSKEDKYFYQKWKDTASFDGRPLSSGKSVAKLAAAPSLSFPLYHLILDQWPLHCSVFLSKVWMYFYLKWEYISLNSGKSVGKLATSFPLYHLTLSWPLHFNYCTSYYKQGGIALPVLAPCV